MKKTGATNVSDIVKLDEILIRLERLESLLLAERLESLEGAEPFEGAGPDVRSAEGVQGTRGVALARPMPRSEEALLEQFIDGFGLPNFRGSEFTPYWSRRRNGVSNSVPPRVLWPNIAPTLAVLQSFRSEFGSIVRLSSTYRSVPYNNAIGGAGESQHTQFRAIDFICHTGTPSAWANLLKSYRGRNFTNPQTGDDFVFRGGIGVYRTFVHIDTRGYDADWTG